MQISINLLILIVCTFLTGLTAGLCFTWANAVTPGIGNLNDLEYLKAFQQMNRVIINPTFIIVFMGPFVLHMANIFLFKNDPNSITWLIIIAAILYILGLVSVTVLGNIPLNEMIDKVNLDSMSLENVRALRTSFENKWNSFHLARTISSCLSFILLLISIVLYSKHI
ncbi:anthrone oxygenase family protein [Seonamhaeicola marinus]|uniref:DUF1772 domain-containing protein n=1 Tax=Seonamhaeicola marinus TaxID=1912246 RepID=A0A5D0HIL9_9FLAO|nr:anthrone oxygenase family protein [Seonamhaeicola marinus]TYA69897.1 DUF1772 domain-containing protein [Seonamhaeicola marinus]